MAATDLHWFKSSYSDSGEPGDCVEVAVTPVTIHIRDSKAPRTAHLTVTATSWTAFLTHVSSADATDGSAVHP